MSVQVETLEKNMAKLTVEVSAEDFKAAIKKAFNKNKNRFAIPGFRKGKAPQAMIEKMYGEGVFYEDAADEAINASYAEAMKESGLDIVSRPEVTIEKIGKDEPFVYSALVAVKPEVTLGQYKGVEVEKADASVSAEDVEAELKKEYDFRLERRNEYLTKYKPMDDVTLFTEELLKQDYYYALLSYGNQCQFKTRKEMDRYHKLLPAINKLYNKGILSARLYDIADEVERYIAYGITYKDKKNPSVEEIMSAVGENELNQYIYTKMAVGSLNANDTLALTTRHTQFDSIVKMPHLRAQVMQIYNQTKSYLENPQPVSNNLLYGEFHENSKLKTSMPYMEPIYNILEKYHGKVIYFDFWARWCPPCLAEMEPLKQLRSKYSTKDLVIYSICVSEPKEEWEECLNEYSLKNRGIECIYASDYFGKDNLQKIRKQWKIDRMPYYLLINRKGQIVDFGTTARPSNPQFVSRIDDALK